MYSKWILLLVLINFIGCAGSPPTIDRRFCFATDPDVAIGGCTAVIQSGQETQQNLVVIFGRRANAYVRKGQYDLAIQDYNDAIQLDPNEAKAFLGRGTVYALKGEFALAILDFDEAIRVNPNFDPAFFNRGMAYRGEGQYNLASRDFNQAIRLNPNQPIYQAAAHNVAKPLVHTHGISIFIL